MGFVDSLLEVVGFSLGIPIGIFLGFLVFIYFEPRDFKKVRLKLLSPLQSVMLLKISYNLHL